MESKRAGILIPESSLDCPLCQIKFDLTDKKPLILHCGHTYCYKCVQSQMKKYDDRQFYSVKCNECNQIVDIFSITDVTVNYFIVNIIEQEQKRQLENNTKTSEEDESSGVVKGSTPTEDEKTELFVGNLPFSTTEGYIRKIFSRYGRVTSTKMPFTPDGRPKGFVFVEFASHEEA